MPNIYEEDGYRFVIYYADHEPAHVHVYKAEGTAKITILTAGVIMSLAMKKSQIKKAKRITREQRDYFWEKWGEINGDE